MFLKYNVFEGNLKFLNREAYGPLSCRFGILPAPFSKVPFLL